MRTSTRFGGTGIDASGATVRQILQSTGGGAFALTETPDFDYVRVVDPSAPTDVAAALTHIGTTGGVLYANSAGGANGVAVQGYDRCVKIYNIGGTLAILLDGDTATATLAALIAATLTGGATSGGNLTLISTSHSTKGKILFGTSGYNEVNNRLGLGTTTPNEQLELTANMRLDNASLIKFAANRMITVTAAGASVFCGGNAGNTTATGNYNVGLGWQSLDALTDGTNDLGIGRDALGACTGGDFNIGVGANALGALTTQDNFTCIGVSSFASVTAGGSSVGIGMSTGLLSTSITNSVFVGFESGRNCGTVTDVTALGYQAGYQCGNGCVMIGYQAGKNETGTNKFYVDNSSTATPLLLGDFSADTLRCNGTFSTGVGNAVYTLDPAVAVRALSTTQNVTQYQTTVNTTTNAVTTVATIPITASYTYLIEARVVARRTGGVAGTADDGASYVRRGTYTTKSGTVTLMGAVQVIGTDAEDQAGWDCTLDISTTNVRVRVTGATNNNITWNADISVQRVNS